MLRTEEAVAASAAPGDRTLIERVAGWSVRHRMAVIAGWFALVVVAVLAGALLPGEDAHSTDPGESGVAQQVLRAQDGFAAPLESVLVRAAGPGGDLRAAEDDLVGSLRATGAVADVTAPSASADGSAGLVTFQIAGTAREIAGNYATAVAAVKAAAARHPGVTMAQAGDRSLATAVDQGIQDDFRRSEAISFPLTVLILLIVFGALIAAGIPLLLALTTVAGTFGLLQVVGQWVPINSATSSMVLLIGVAVCIDYTLFYLRRTREERAAGHGVGEALRIAARTSGHAVVVSGLTVLVCLTGLLFTGLDNFRGLTVGAVLVVGLAVIGSVTVLPALLALLGHRVDAGRLPGLGRRRTAATGSRFWASVARAVVRRPLLWGGVAVSALVVVSLPALGLRLQDAAVTDSLPRDVPTVDAAIRMQEQFPGAASPARIVLWHPDGSDVDSPALRTALDEMSHRVAGPVTTVKVDKALVVRVPLAGSGTDGTSDRALETLREDVLPTTVGEVGGVDYAVAGRTAVAHDFAATLRARSAYVFAFVLILAFILLAVAFRSLTVPVVSIVLNLLSIGAAYGVLTWVFQDGHLGPALGFTSYGGVVSWLPLFMFVMLFGLSMDYHIFILSRVRERWTAATDHRPAIIAGSGGSTGVVTSAAVVMTAVFTVFITLSAIEYKMLGVGMAVAVVIDATVIRGVLLPAALALLGRRAFPRTPARREPARRPAQ